MALPTVGLRAAFESTRAGGRISVGCACSMRTTASSAPVVRTGPSSSEESAGFNGWLKQWCPSVPWMKRRPSVTPPSGVAPTRAPVWPTADNAGGARTRRIGSRRSGVRACEAREGFRSIEQFGGAKIASVRPSNCSMASRAPCGGCERRQRTRTVPQGGYALVRLELTPRIRVELFLHKPLARLSHAGPGADRCHTPVLRRTRSPAPV